MDTKIGGRDLKELSVPKLVQIYEFLKVYIPEKCTHEEFNIICDYGHDMVHDPDPKYLKHCKICKTHIDLTIEESILNIKDARNKAKLEIVSFGFGPDVLRELGINESAIGSDFDKNAFIKLKGMLGEMHAIPIDKYVVIYNTNSTNVLVAKAF